MKNRLQNTVKGLSAAFSVQNAMEHLLLLSTFGKGLAQTNAGQTNLHTQLFVINNLRLTERSRPKR